MLVENSSMYFQFVLSERLKNMESIWPFLYAHLKMGCIMWLGMAGGRPPSFPHNNFSSVIWSLPNMATWFPCRRGRTLFILGSLGQRSLLLWLEFLTTSFPHDKFSSRGSGKTLFIFGRFLAQWYYNTSILSHQVNQYNISTYISW